MTLIGADRIQNPRNQSRHKIASALSSFLIGASFIGASTAGASLGDLREMKTSDFLIKKGETGCQPKGVKSDSRGEYLYVAEMCGEKDPVTHRLMKDANGNYIPSVSIFDLRTMSLVRTVVTPMGARHGIIGNTEVEFTSDDKYALVARAEAGADSPVYPGFGMVTAIDAHTQKIAKYIPVNGQGAKIIMRRPEVAEEGHRQIIYVANYFSDDISILDVTNLTSSGSLKDDAAFVKKVKLESAFANPAKRGYRIAPRGVAFTPDGKYAIILATETGSIIVMDSVQHKQIAELPPVPKEVAGREVNVRHIVTSNDGQLAYLSHMRGNAISRISVPKLIQMARATSGGVLPASAWNDLLVPFANGKKLIIVEQYPKDHPNFPGKTWEYADPNTIVLDPVNNRYLYVSNRTRTEKDYNVYDTRIKGKVDIIDTRTGEVIFILVGGAQPTALEVTPDNRTLISGGFKDDKLYFFDLEKLLSIYERGSVLRP